MKCPYCGRIPEFVGGAKIYPHRPDLAHKRFYLCAPCDAYVGSHHGSTRPLGRLANAELRAWKMKAHAAFDPLWKPRGSEGAKMSRSEAYRWLAWCLGIDGSACHIGMFDVELCKRTVHACTISVTKTG